MSFQIRAATPADVEVIAANNAVLALETEHRRLAPHVVRSGVAAALADPAKGRYFVAERMGEVVGQIMHTYEWSDWRNGCFWWIQSVYVTEDARSQGVFRSLFEHLRTLARSEPDVCGIRLYVERDNARAQQTYLQCGLMDTGYFVMEDDFSGAVTRLGG
jgi:GNAT superfamily N-acetyltransferase